MTGVRLRKTLGLARRYPLVPATILVGIVTAVLGAVAPGVIGAWLAGGYALAVALWVAIGMVRELRSGRWGIDLLAVVAVVSTVLVGDHWAALIVVLMITGGRALEDFASNRAQDQLRALIDRTPRVAHRMGSDGGEVLDVPVEQLAVGDLLLIKPGETVPVDGDLLDDQAEMDESSLTGESLPVLHRRGDRLRSGSVAGADTLHLRAVALARDSEYQQIVQMVQDAAGTKSRFIRIADRVAVPFSAVSFLIGGLAWLVSGDPVRFAEVLVVATPCSLLIAAPVAIVAGMGLASRHGVVVKDGDALSKLARPAVVAFDKTGTLTRGTPEVARVEPLDGSTGTEVLAVAAALESGSAHVLAQAIVRAAADAGVPASPVAGLKERPGLGLEGTIDGRPARVGRPAYAGVEESPAGAGESVVYVALDGRPLGRIVLSDAIRQESGEVIARLRDLGVRSFMMLSGDSPATTGAVGRLLGIDQVRGGLLPGEKLAAVAAIDEHPVVMVGDGVNDAPVLAAADVGVAMGARGATAASESADAVILSDSLQPLADAVEIAQRTRRIALQSITVGVSLSILLMLVATTGVIPATVGALLQEAVDLITILNGLRAARLPRARAARPRTSGTLDPVEAPGGVRP